MKILIDKATVELALEALEFYVKEDDVIEGMEGNEYWVEGKRSAEKSIVAFQKALAQPEQEPDCYGYAARLATSIWKQHYQKTAPEWEVFNDLIGVLTQIDNMAAGLISPPLPVQPEQEPVAFDAFLNSKKFYELMQTYRHFQIDAFKQFEAVKDALRAAHNIGVNK